MSEAAPEAAPRRGGNFLTRKAGPLPVWGWAALGAGGYLLYRWWSSRSAASTSATTAAATAAATPSSGIDYAPQIATLQAEIQQLQGQVSQGESSEGGKGKGGGGKPPGPKPPIPFPPYRPPGKKPGPKPQGRRYRHVSTGKQSFTELVKGRHTTIADIVATSRQAPETMENLEALESWASHPGQKRRGIVYYTKNP
ncbi:MAG: hypothetical protein M0030_29130 [Actinomycetota bacterium]|nr:hypothetical protein [Actinomycetota bacterium]